MKLNILAAVLLVPSGVAAFTTQSQPSARSSSALSSATDGGMGSYEAQMRAMMSGAAPVPEQQPVAPVEEMSLEPPTVGEVEVPVMDEPPTPAGLPSFGVKKNFFAATKEGKFYDKWRTVESGEGKVPIREKKMTPFQAPIAAANFAATKEDAFFDKWQQVESGEGKVPVREAKSAPTTAPIAAQNFAATNEEAFFQKWRQVENGDAQLPMRELKSTTRPDHAPIRADNFSATKQDAFFDKWRQVDNGEGKIPAQEVTFTQNNAPISAQNFSPTKEAAFYDKWRTVEDGQK